MVLDKDVRQQAYKSIRESLDVVNIVKELDNLRLVVSVMLEEYHRDLVPLIAVGMKSNYSSNSKQDLSNPKDIDTDA